MCLDLRYVVAVWDVAREWDAEYLRLQQHSMWETAVIMVCSMTMRTLMDAFDGERQITKGMTLEVYNQLLESLGRRSEKKRHDKAGAVFALPPVLTQYLRVLYAPVRLLPTICLACVVAVPWATAPPLAIEPHHPSP